MKVLKYLLSTVLLLAFTASCTVQDGIDQDTSFLNSANSEAVNAIFDITNDNSGNVKITPTGLGVTSFDINFGDDSGEIVAVSPGENTIHSYPEGSYSVKIISNNIAGGTMETDFPLQITYRVPENLMVNPAIDIYNATVKPEALYANSYLVYFGDVENEVGTPIAAGDTSPGHTYTTYGVYDIKVVALSGGEAKTETTQSITIFDPLALPYTGELASQNYLAGGTFGGANFSIVENPFPTGLNTSANVPKFEKPIGAEEWAGTWIPLDVPIDLGTGTKIKMLVYVTEAGKKVGLELQDSPNDAPNTAIFATTTLANQWEELVFDTTTIPEIPDGAKYKQFNINYNRPNMGLGEVIYIDNIRLTN
jgi:hypothetical protein